MINIPGSILFASPMSRMQGAQGGELDREVMVGVGCMGYSSASLCTIVLEGLLPPGESSDGMGLSWETGVLSRGCRSLAVDASVEDAFVSSASAVRTAVRGGVAYVLQTSK